MGGNFEFGNFDVKPYYLFLKLIQIYKSTIMRLLKMLLLFVLLVQTSNNISAQISLIKVRIETNTGAQIGIDDEMSDTNIFEKELVSGEHVVIVKYNGNVVKREVISISPGGAYNEKFEIGGNVKIESQPEGILTVDGVDVGSTPQELNLLGQHNIGVRYKNKKYGSVKESFTVSPLENIERNYVLKKNRHAYEWKWHILVNGFLPTTKVNDVQPGLMIGFAKVIGFYAKGSIGVLYDIKQEPESWEPIWGVGKHACNFLSGGGGLMYNIIQPLYVYAGAGYGEFKAGQKDYFGNYIQTDSFSGVYYEAGLLFSYKKLAINAGCMLCDGNVIVNAGIGVSL